MISSEYFRRAEFACKCQDKCGFDTVDAELLRILDAGRRHFNRPIVINCGCRCPAHNAAVGGAPSSQHLYGRAADIRAKGFSPRELYWYFTGLYLGRYGFGLYDSFVHVDTRTDGPARWDET